MSTLFTLLPSCPGHGRFPPLRLAIASICLLALSACGGGGGGGGGDVSSAKTTSVVATVADAASATGSGTTAATPAASAAGTGSAAPAASAAVVVVSAPVVAVSAPATTTAPVTTTPVATTPVPVATTPVTIVPVVTTTPATPTAPSVPATPAAPATPVAPATPATPTTPVSTTPVVTTPVVTTPVVTTPVVTAPVVVAPVVVTAPVVVAVAAPVIAAQPQSLVLNGGKSASFSVQATGSGTLTFQWARAGTPIAGAASATYTLAAVTLADNGAAFTVAVTNAGGTTTSAAARLTVNAVTAKPATAARPFSDQSLWNSRPTQFVLGTTQVPTSFYFPTVGDGPYSLSAAVAAPTDGAVTVMGIVGAAGLWIADAEAYVPQVVIPHWPASVTPATGTDGHADIIDVAGNKIHSFWQLKNVDGQWRAAQYTWTALDGSGWGTPAQYMQGSRAAGVPTIAGVIRVAEVDDGLPAYQHALAMSMPETALSATPAYTFPATSADGDAYWVNKGSIPEGARMMLPADFDMSKISNPRLIKIVQTLKSYGAYVVDKNFGTPFVIYVENGSNFSLMPNGWDNQVANELDLIRAGLRQVLSVSQWVDASGVPFMPERNLNLLSMRGSWYVQQGSAPGVFDTWQQAVIFPNSGQQTLQINSSGRSTQSLLVAQPAAGQLYKLTVSATGGATMRVVFNRGGPDLYDTGYVGDGAVVTFRWPAEGMWPWVLVASNPQGGGKISGTLVAAGSQ